MANSSQAVLMKLLCEGNRPACSRFVASRVIAKLEFHRDVVCEAFDVAPREEVQELVLDRNNLWQALALSVIAQGGKVTIPHNLMVENPRTIIATEDDLMGNVVISASRDTEQGGGEKKPGLITG